MTSGVRLAIRWDPRHFAGAVVCRNKNSPGNRTWRRMYRAWLQIERGHRARFVGAPYENLPFVLEEDPDCPRQVPTPGKRREPQLQDQAIQQVAHG